MPKITAAIIDDEPFARERVRRLLSEDADVEIVGEAGDGVEAVDLIRGKRPALVFLDVQMPGRDGFEVLAELEEETMPLVIFLTAFDRYAVKAFETAALDYLLKPFDEERFKKALDRAKSRLVEENAPDENETGEIFRTENGCLDRVLVKKGGRVYFYRTDEIERIEAEGNYVRLYFDDRVHLLRETISSLEQQLDPKKFARIHRSSLVNLGRIRELEPIFGGRAKLVLTSGAQLTVSRRFYRQLAKIFEKK
jgi:two-component system, LytTR family, response regulator